MTVQAQTNQRATRQRASFFLLPPSCLLSIKEPEASHRKLTKTLFFRPSFVPFRFVVMSPQMFSTEVNVDAGEPHLSVMLICRT